MGSIYNNCSQYTLVVRDWKVAFTSSLAENGLDSIYHLYIMIWEPAIKEYISNP